MPLMVQAQESSRFSRTIINLFAGMAFGSPDLPRILVECGYACHSIEQTFPVGVGKVVNPEIILCSDSEKHTLIVEAKSGANLNESQLSRYALIPLVQLVQAAQISDKAAATYNVLIIGQENHMTRLSLGSKNVPDTNRVLSVKVDNGIKKIENKFISSKLDTAFSPTLLINWECVPNNFLPVDHESEPWEFAEQTVPEIVAAILRGELEILIDELAVSFIKNWAFISQKYKTSLKDKIRNVVKVASQNRFSEFVSINQKGNSKNKITLSIPAALAGNRSKLRARLQRQQNLLMSDLKSPQIQMIFGP